MLIRNFLAAQLAILSFFAVPALASSLVPVELAPIKHNSAELVIVSPDGTETSYSPEQLEGFTSYQLQTKTPWREETTSFEGVLLNDLLGAHGLHDVEAIVVTAENDYATTIPRELWMDIEVLVATRVDGRPHTRRARGPIQFVIDLETMEGSDVANQGHLVWMAARIEAAE